MTWSGNLTSIAPRSLRPRLLFSLFPISSLFPVFAQTLVLPFDQDCHQIPSCLCLVFFFLFPVTQQILSINGRIASHFLSPARPKSRDITFPNLLFPRFIPGGSELQFGHFWAPPPRIRGFWGTEETVEFLVCQEVLDGSVDF